jgi:antitoxin component of MazEF toxin-antitoxin module
MPDQFFKQGDQIGVWVPEAEVKRYHLADGVEVEVVPMEEGILLRPVGVAPWFTIEWEQALDAVLEWYGPALEQLGEEPEVEESAEAQPEEQPHA